MTEPTGLTVPLSADRAPRPVHVPPEQTTLPRYPPPVLDPAPHLVVAIGDAAADRADGLLRGRSGEDRWLRSGDGPAAVTVVDAALAALTTGWRVLAVGPERDVQAVRATALAAGALDEEIVLVATDVDDPIATRVRRLFCGACRHRFDARAAVGDPVACPACRAALGLTEHHSRRHAAFLAVPSGWEVP